LRMLAPSTIVTMRPRGGRESFEQLVQLVERLPAYWLQIGSRLDDIPRCVSEILADARLA